MARGGRVAGGDAGVRAGDKIHPAIAPRSELLKCNPRWQAIQFAGGNPVGDPRRPPSTETEVRCTNTVCVQLPVLDKDLSGTTMIYPVVGVDL